MRNEGEGSKVEEREGRKGIYVEVDTMEFYFCQTKFNLTLFTNNKLGSILKVHCNSKF